MDSISLKIHRRNKGISALNGHCTAQAQACEKMHVYMSKELGSAGRWEPWTAPD